jgi:hypothetical protein
MNQTDIRQVIEARLINNWSDNNVAFENVPYTPPDEQHWVRLSVQFLVNNYNGLGECREIIGIVGVQIFSPIRQGTYRQEQLTDEATALYQGSHNGIAYQDINEASAGEVEGWYQSNVLINFTARGE